MFDEKLASLFRLREKFLKSCVMIADQKPGCVRMEIGKTFVVSFVPTLKEVSHMTPEKNPFRRDDGSVVDVLISRDGGYDYQHYVTSSALRWLRAWFWRQLSETTHEFIDANSRWPHWRCSAVLIGQFRYFALLGAGAVILWALAIQPFVAPDFWKLAL